MSAYYNEIDSFAAQWLRNLIIAGHIAPGDVDERSIVDVRPDDLRGYRQCHFFAGIGVWSHALRLAGWGDDRDVWTGSCPCQPFSVAGKQQADADERHLWPHWLRLIGECRPSALFGEQVGAAIGVGWLDDVFVSLEGIGYACGAADFPACSVGAPHIRQRVYFVAESAYERRDSDCGQAWCGEPSITRGRSNGDGHARNGEREIVDVGDAINKGLQEQQWQRGISRGQDDAEPRETVERAGASVSGMAYASGSGSSEFGGRRDESTRFATAGFWRDAEWLQCRDGKARPTKPGISPLAHGTACRVGKLRAYGNAIVAPQAAEFVSAYMDIAA